MKTPSKLPAGAPAPEQPIKQRILKRPGTRQGWWAVIMAVLFVLLYIINTTVFQAATVATPLNEVVLPVYGFWMLLCGLAAGISALLAVFRQGERSWLVWLAMLPGLMALFLVLGELLGA